MDRVTIEEDGIILSLQTVDHLLVPELQDLVGMFERLARGAGYHLSGHLEIVADE